MRDKFIYKVLMNSVALFVTAQYLTGPRFALTGVLAAVVAALILGFVNAFIKPIIVILSLPINILTLGLLTLAINGLMLKITAAIVPGMHLVGFWTSIWSAILISALSMLLNAVLGD